MWEPTGLEPPCLGCRAHLEVLLHLLIHLVQCAGPVLRKGAGLLVPLVPLRVGVLIHLFVGQAQRAQGLLGKGLGTGRAILSPLLQPLWHLSSHCLSQPPSLRLGFLNLDPHPRSVLPRGSRDHVPPCSPLTQLPKRPRSVLPPDLSTAVPPPGAPSLHPA